MANELASFKDWLFQKLNDEICKMKKWVYTWGMKDGSLLFYTIWGSFYETLLQSPFHLTENIVEPTIYMIKIYWDNFKRQTVGHSPHFLRDCPSLIHLSLQSSPSEIWQFLCLSISFLFPVKTYVSYLIIQLSASIAYNYFICSSSAFSKTV